MSLKYLFNCLARAFFKLHMSCKCSRCCECDSDCIEAPTESPTNTPPITPKTSPLKKRKLPKIPTEKMLV